MATNHMASSRNVPKNGVIFILLLLLLLGTLSLPISVGSVGGDEELIKARELVIGSRPPRCVNKCLNCRPCVAALVISQRHKQGILKENDDGYYLLSWKCKCKDKYFKP